ncbi:SulP family inorganic anion transporter [Acidisoma cellulosilytica]|uniref:SulP family inorganic anion transporter n=1 Tax=Acidisoma cellulosilyticum TaxID=2802395 RepID=A0A963Z6Q2_9PROT|nr:SulP family inorganic anion transporter [Acidisoma cellulosilyticum]MCB8883511.1 SulP family inorganic anion transporter [Acidisoma cellulosilyticum]
MTIPTAKARKSAGYPWIFSGLRGFSPSWLPHDLAAGLLLTAIAVPEQIATARLAGMPPEAGLVAFVAATIAFVMVGANRFLSVGADSTIAPIIAGSLVALAAVGSTQYQALAAILAIMVGVILSLAALFRAGWIADLLSIPVTTGFLAGIAIHIGLRELPPLLGLTGDDASLTALLHQANAINPYALALGLGACATTVLTERLAPRLPGALFAVLLGGAAVRLFHLQAAGVTMLAALPGVALHAPAWRGLALIDLARLVPLALIIALICMMQTATVVRSFSQSEGPLAAVMPNVLGVGLGSILSGCAGAFPVNASPPRTAAIVEGGGRSQLASLVAAGLVVLLLVAGGDFLRYVPLPALAGILTAIAIRLFRLREMMRIARQGGAEIYLVGFSAILVILLPIEIGMLASIALSLIQSIYGVARPRAVELAHLPGTTVWWPPSPGEQGESIPGILVFAIGAPVNFTNALYICRQLDALIAQAPSPLHLVVLEASGVTEIDYTGATILMAELASLRQRGTKVALARLAAAKAQDAARRTGLIASIGADRVFHTVEDAVRHASKITR